MYGRQTGRRKRGRVGRVKGGAREIGGWNRYSGEGGLGKRVEGWAVRFCILEG